MSPPCQGGEAELGWTLRNWRTGFILSATTSHMGEEVAVIAL